VTNGELLMKQLGPAESGLSLAVARVSTYSVLAKEQEFMKKSVSYLVLIVASVVCLGGIPLHAITFELHNHPDEENHLGPPGFGFRLDGLVDSDPTHKYTFNFDYTHADFQSDMRLDYDGSSIDIHGSVFGGRDNGSDYLPNDPFSGIYEIDFSYRTNVQGDLDNGLFVNPEDHLLNTGTIAQTHAYDSNTDSFIALLQPIIYDLVDEDRYKGYSLKLNDNNNYRLQNYPAYPYQWEGWGWVNHSSTPGFPETHMKASDWVFTAAPVAVTDDGSAGILLAFSCIGMVLIRHRK